MANTEKKEKKKFQFKMPHTYVILISIMVLMLVLTHIIPAGEYDRVEDPVSGKMVVVADSYHEIDVEAPGIFDLFLALQEGYVDAADIMFLIIFAYGFVYVLTKNGTMDAALGTMVRKIGSRVSLLIPITMLVLGILGSTMGIYEEVYGLFPVFVGIFMALEMCIRDRDTNFTVELQQRVDGKYVSAGTKKVTLKKDATTVSDDGDKFLLDNGSVYKVVVNGVESNEVKGR